MLFAQNPYDDLKYKEYAIFEKKLSKIYIYATFSQHHVSALLPFYRFTSWVPWYCRTNKVQLTN